MRFRFGRVIGPWVWMAAGLLAAAPTSAGLTPERVLREIRDPHTGLTWLLEKDGRNSGGPGRMMVAAQDSATEPKPIVIRAGDTVVVEEHTPAAEASLEAVALGAAKIGSRLDVRLKIGGKVLRAVALAPRRAALISFGEARP